MPHTPYTPTEWEDEVLAGAERYNILDNGGSPIEENVQIELETTVTTEGTPINAANLLNMENELVALDTEVFIDGVEKILETSGPGTLDIADIEDGEFLSRQGTDIKGAPPVRYTYEASSATPAINTDLQGSVRRFHEITALATNITSLSTYLTGTPAVGDVWLFKVTASGGTRTIAHGASFAAGISELVDSVADGDSYFELFFWDGSVWLCLSSGPVA